MDSHKLRVATQGEIERVHAEFKKNPNARGALAVLAQRVGSMPEVRRLVCKFEDRDLHPLGTKPYYTLHHDHPSIYLLGWREGEWTDVHDHGDAEVGIYVVEGQVTEDIFVTEPVARNWDKDRTNFLQFSRTLRQGDLATCPKKHVHSVGNIMPECAATLHVYGPDLRDMRLYDSDEKKGILRFKDTWHNCHDPKNPQH